MPAAIVGTLSAILELIEGADAICRQLRRLVQAVLRDSWIWRIFLIQILIYGVRIRCKILEAFPAATLLYSVGNRGCKRVGCGMIRHLEQLDVGCLREVAGKLDAALT